jgi:hypothetical protein
VLPAPLPPGKRPRQVTFVIPPGVDPTPHHVFRGKGQGLRIAPLPEISKEKSGDIGAFGKLCEFSPAYLASVLANCAGGEEEEQAAEGEE